jgi:hypothetical protein
MLFSGVPVIADGHPCAGVPAVDGVPAGSGISVVPAAYAASAVEAPASVDVPADAVVSVFYLRCVPPCFVTVPMTSLLLQSSCFSSESSLVLLRTCSASGLAPLVCLGVHTFAGFLVIAGFPVVSLPDVTGFPAVSVRALASVLADATGVCIHYSYSV